MGLVRWLRGSEYLLFFQRTPRFSSQNPYQKGHSYLLFKFLEIQLLCLFWAPGFVYTNPHRNIHKHIIKNKNKCFSNRG